VTLVDSRPTLESVVLATPEQVSCDIAGEAVLLSMRDGEYYGLNEVAASIWRLIQQPQKVGHVRDALLEEFEDIDAVECERAVLGFLNEMISLRLVDVVAAGS